MHSKFPENGLQFDLVSVTLAPLLSLNLVQGVQSHMSGQAPVGVSI